MIYQLNYVKLYCKANDRFSILSKKTLMSANDQIIKKCVRLGLVKLRDLIFGLSHKMTKI